MGRDHYADAGSNYLCENTNELNLPLRMKMRLWFFDYQYLAGSHYVAEVQHHGSEFGDHG